MKIADQEVLEFVLDEIGSYFHRNGYVHIESVDNKIYLGGSLHLVQNLDFPTCQTNKVDYNERVRQKELNLLPTSSSKGM